MIILASLAQDLQQPEYIHVLLNPLPIYGLGIAVLGLVVAMICRSRAARVTTLALIFVSALSAWPVDHFGEEAYDRVLSMENDDGGAWLKAHMERAETFIFVYYVLAALALAALLAPLKWPRTETPLVVITLLLGVAALAAGSWIAYAGGRVRHSEFRNSPPPKVEAHEHSH